MTHKGKIVCAVGVAVVVLALSKAKSRGVSGMGGIFDWLFPDQDEQSSTPAFPSKTYLIPSTAMADRLGPVGMRFQWNPKKHDFWEFVSDSGEAASVAARNTSPYKPVMYIPPVKAEKRDDWEPVILDGKAMFRNKITGEFGG